MTNFLTKYLSNKTDKHAARTFLLDNTDADIYSLNKSFLMFYYSMSPKLQDEIEISYLWGIVIKEWCKRKEYFETWVAPAFEKLEFTEYLLNLKNTRTLAS